MSETRQPEVTATTFKIGDSDLGMDHLKATVFRGEVSIEIDSPWAGDTETGFG
jgi:hypothetical protein